MRRLFSAQQYIEIFTRIMVREGFKTVLHRRLETDVLDEFERVLFGIVYPTPPKRHSFDKLSCVAF